MDDNKTKSIYSTDEETAVSKEGGLLRCMGCMEEFSSEYEICPHCGYVVNTKPRLKCYLAPGTWLAGNYMLGKVIGQGGFGITYIAWDKKGNRKVAVKEFFPNSLSTRGSGETEVACYNEKAEKHFREGVRKMLDEGDRLSSFRDNENIVTVYDYFEENGTAYIVMEYLDGKSLKEYAEEKGGKLDPKEAISLMLPVLNALSAMHKEKMIHRDVAPDNIYICRSGKVKLLDFGSARLAVQDANKSLSVMVKPGYAPTEQYASRSKQGPWTDVYSVCATLYRLITGEAPVESIERDVTPLKPIESFGVDCPEALKNILDVGLDPDPQERFSSAEELATFLSEDCFETDKKESAKTGKKNSDETAKKGSDETENDDPFGAGRISFVGDSTPVSPSANNSKKIIIGAIALLVAVVAVVAVVAGIPMLERLNAADRYEDDTVYEETTEAQTEYNFDADIGVSVANSATSHTHIADEDFDDSIIETVYHFTERFQLTERATQRPTQRATTTRRQATTTRRQTSTTQRKQMPTGLTLSSYSGTLNRRTASLMLSPYTWETTPGKTNTLSVSNFIMGFPTVSFKATVTPGSADDTSVTVSSSDTSVAMVSTSKNGNVTTVTVTAYDAGTSKITVRCKADQSISAVYTITVTEDEVYYYSSNTNVVTVSGSGVMTSRAPGKATVTVVAGEYSQECEVTVNDPATEPSTARVTTTRAVIVDPPPDEPYSDDWDDEPYSDDWDDEPYSDDWDDEPYSDEWDDEPYTDEWETLPYYHYYSEDADVGFYYD